MPNDKMHFHMSVTVDAPKKLPNVLTKAMSFALRHYFSKHLNFMAFLPMKQEEREREGDKKKIK